MNSDSFRRAVTQVITTYLNLPTLTKLQSVVIIELPLCLNNLYLLVQQGDDANALVDLTQENLDSALAESDFGIQYESISLETGDALFQTVGPPISIIMDV